MIVFGSSKLEASFFKLIRYIYPIIFSGYFYSETVFYNKLFFKNLDPYFINIDQFIFGFQPSLEFSKTLSNPFFSELMYFGYFSFYILIISFIITLYFKQKKHFTELIFKFTFSFFLFYLFFGIFPSAGPQFYLPQPERNLPSAFFFDKIMHFIQANAEQPTGAFPSSHVGISIIILLISKKYISKFYKIVLPFVLILILSTIYIKAHYAIDVIVGILIAPFILYLAKLTYKSNLLKKVSE